jgi:predicted metal-dependent phosphoesterase TrpH
MIDLHIHTTYSDGTDGLITILKKANDLGLEYISITDHNTCKAYEELESINVSDYYNGQIIPGCEIFCIYDQVIIELLAYNIDTKKLSQWFNENPSDLSPEGIAQSFSKRIISNCLLLGLELDSSFTLLREEKHVARAILEELQKHPNNKNILPADAWENPAYFYRKCICNPNSPFFVDQSIYYKYSVAKAIEGIKYAGGLIFIAHFFMYPFENPKEQLSQLVENYNIDGIEAHYSYHTPEEINFLTDYCTKNNLYMSGGSDYHGTFKPGIFLGKGFGNLHVPTEIIKPWREYL